MKEGSQTTAVIVGRLQVEKVGTESNWDGIEE
jgi:hypothetical protein